MKIFSATVTTAVQGTSYLVTEPGTPLTVAAGRRICTVVASSGASPKHCVFLQTSPDGSNWSDLNCDWVLPMGATAAAYAKGTTTANTRDIYKTTGTAIDGCNCAQATIPVGYVRAAIANDTTPGSCVFEIHLN